MNSQKVGRWKVDAQQEHHFEYDPDWIKNPAGRALSLSMPLRPGPGYRGDAVRNFFENLLPDSDEIRRRLQTRFQTDSNRAFDLLREVGRDCVGAVQLTEESVLESPLRPAEGDFLGEEEIAALLRAASGAGWGQTNLDDLRISLAGAQEKTALTFVQGRWMRPTGSTPTTHIFKLPLGRFPSGLDLSTSVANEWLCHAILRELDVPVAPAQIARFEDLQVLVVERFDRRWNGGVLLRLPQEDLCQAFGVPPAKKYESDGGPGVRKIMTLLLGSSRAQADRTDFFRTLMIFWLLAAIDGHAKNFSLFLEPGGGFRLTPRYDVLSAYPVVGSALGNLRPQELKMAMKVWGESAHYHWERIKRHHWGRTGSDCGVFPAAAEIWEALFVAVPAALERVESQLPTDCPAELAEAILGGTRKALERARRDQPLR